jgi:hypothetical protein
MVTLDAAQRHGWRLIEIEHATELTPDRVLQVTLQQLRPLLATSPTRQRPSPGC